MAQHEVPPRSTNPACAALGAVFSAHVGVLALNESYRTVPAVLTAYAAWWIVRQGTAR